MDILIHSIITIIAFLIVVPLVGLICILIHEIGHVVGALLVGFRVYAFSAGPFSIIIKNGKAFCNVGANTLKVYLGRAHISICDVCNDKSYNKLGGKIAIVALSGPFFELCNLLLLIQYQKFIDNDLIRVLIITTVATLFSLTFFFNVDAFEAMKVFWDNVSKEGYTYLWTVYGNSNDNKTKEFIIKKFLEKANKLTMEKCSMKKISYIRFYFILLELYLLGYTEQIPTNISITLETFVTKIKRVSNKKGIIKDAYICLFYRYLTYKVFAGNDKEEVKQLFFENQDLKSIKNSKVTLYEKKRLEQMLGIKDNLSYIRDIQNIPEFYTNDDGYHEVNRLINIKCGIITE